MLLPRGIVVLLYSVVALGNSGWCEFSSSIGFFTSLQNSPFFILLTVLMYMYEHRSFSESFVRRPGQRDCL